MLSEQLCGQRQLVESEMIMDDRSLKHLMADMPLQEQLPPMVQVEMIFTSLNWMRLEMYNGTKVTVVQVQIKDGKSFKHQIVVFVLLDKLRLLAHLLMIFMW